MPRREEPGGETQLDESLTAGLKIDRRDLLKTTAGGMFFTGAASRPVGGLKREANIDDSSGGEVVWTFETGDTVRSSPTVVDGVVYIGSDDNNIYALDTASGEEIWSFETGDKVRSSPSVVDGTAFFGSRDGSVYAMDAATGDEEWTFQTGSVVTSSPTVVDNTIFIGSNDNNLYALDAATGEERWRFYTGGAVRSSPTVVDDTVFIGSFNGVYALDTTTGDERWRDFEEAVEVTSSPTVVDDTVFIATWDSVVYALDAVTGERQWYSFTGLPVVPSSPTVMGGTVFISGGDENVYALDAATGDEQWAFETGGESGRSSPTVVDDTVFIGSNDENVYALDAATGDEQWAFETGSGVGSSPTVVDGTIFIGSADGIVYALDAGVDGSSKDSRVNLGTLGHHHVFAERGPTGPGVSERLEPNASFTFSPESPETGETVTFDASASKGDIVEYSWDFTADGETDVTGETVEYVFEEKGEVTITLTVVDPDGDEDTATESFEVELSVFEQRVEGKLETAAEIDDVAQYISESEDVEAVIDGIRDELYQGDIDEEMADQAILRLNLGEDISRRLLYKTSNKSRDVADDEQVAVDTTKFSIDLAVSLGLSQLALVDVLADSRFGYLVPDPEILRQKLDTTIEELIGLIFSKAGQSEALLEVNHIVQEAYERLLADEFSDFEAFFSFISDSVSAAVANLTLMQTIETGSGFAPRSVPEFTFVDQFTNVESSLGYLNQELNSDSLVVQGLDGTRQGALDARGDARNLLDEIASVTDTFLAELADRVDTVGIIENAYGIIKGLFSGELPTAEAAGLIAGLVPNASYAVSVVQIIGQYVGELSIRLMMTTHAWGIAGVQRGDPISLADISSLVPDVESILAELDPTEDRWGEFV